MKTAKGKLIGTDGVTEYVERIAKRENDDAEQTRTKKMEYAELIEMMEKMEKAKLNDAEKTNWIMEKHTKSKRRKQN